MKLYVEICFPGAMKPVLRLVFPGMGGKNDLSPDSLSFLQSYFGYGFHEDALQSGLAAAEQLGGVRRPWDVEDENGRISGMRSVSPPISLKVEAA